MLEVKDIRVWREPPDRNNLFWRYLSSSDKLTDFRVIIERDYSPEFSDFRIVADLPATDNFFIDNQDINHYNLIDYYYRLRVRHLLSSAEWISQPVTFTIPVDREILTILENELLYLKRYVNRPVYLFKRKREGPRCVCYDEYRQEATQSSCDLCYGTGFYGGFYGPFEMYMQMSAAVRNEQRDYSHVEHGQQLNGWTVYSILIEPADVIIDPALAQVMIVQNINLTEWHRMPVMQLVQGFVPNISDPVFRLLKKFNYQQLMAK